MQGSVEEWIWNEANNEYPPAWPADYAGPAEDGGVDLPRTARGGSYFTEAANMDGRLYDNMGGPDQTEHADLGFRCVKSRL
jgi:formylglycine-generating enzyme required for sulfatase activity